MTRRAAWTIAAALSASAAAIPAGASAQSGTFRGPHPVDLDGHWHFEDAEHVHDGLPVGPGPFGEVEGVLVFLGDPVAYGYDGEVWTYEGAHPLSGGLRGYCGLTRSHRHPFAPEGSYRRTRDGAYVFSGGMRGGRAMVVPSRLEPDEPVIVAPPAGVTTPFLFAGCTYAFHPGGRGGWWIGPAPGCTCAGPPRWRRGGVAPAAPPDDGSYYDGNYGRVGSVDARSPRVGRQRPRN